MSIVTSLCRLREAGIWIPKALRDDTSNFCCKIFSLNANFLVPRISFLPLGTLVIPVICLRMQTVLFMFLPSVMTWNNSRKPLLFVAKGDIFLLSSLSLWKSTSCKYSTESCLLALERKLTWCREIYIALQYHSHAIFTTQFLPLGNCSYRMPWPFDHWMMNWNSEVLCSPRI